MPMRGNEIRRRLLGLSPAVAALAYPFLLQGFHAAVSSGNAAVAAVFLLLAFAAPLWGLVCAYRLAGAAQPTRFDLRARRLAYASIAAPPLFVFAGVGLGLVAPAVPDVAAWIAVWLVAGLAVALGGNQAAPVTPASSIAGWRVAHGVAAALIACFVLFHLANHLSGLDSPQTHAAIMKAGRKVYRAALVEPVLVVLLLFQAASGIRLAWRWSAARTDAYRVFQVGSGAYLAAFILTHMNSVFVSARAVHKIETGWDYASGAPTGLILDAWNIRLLPHYALGVFFVLGHLASGLRVVLIAHGFDTKLANRAWAAGLAVAALIAAAVVSGLCGVRL
jgi:hypothetical protein